MQNSSFPVFAFYNGPELEENERVIECEFCGGDGCLACDGSGEQIITLNAVTLDDMDPAP